jgi:cation diffusion facilitator CzcD-associated flavoprotein CzcO
MLPTGLTELAAQARHDLARMNYPAPNWVPPAAGPDGKPMLDVLIAGAGGCGQTAAFALARDGVRNVRVVDRAQRGREGPWATYARMQTLRSPKHLTGPDLGFPTLTFRAWYEAQHGREGWERLYKIATLDWWAYLMWVRDTVGLAVESGTEVTGLAPYAGGVRVELKAPSGPEAVYARKVVLAGGRDGAGAPYMPAFPSLHSADAGAGATAGGRVFHSADPVDFARFKGGRIGVLGASASAFDNAAAALETGAAEAHLFVRRPHLPQVNKSKWASFPGFFLGYRDLDDATRWQIYTYILSEAVPPPHESVLRCDRHAGFVVHLAEPWLDVIAAPDGVTVVTAKARYAFDAVILATGFSVDMAERPELAGFHDCIALWSDRVAREEAKQHPDLARFPYLGRGFELIERTPGAMPGLAHIHLFNAGATMSQAALAGDIPGMAFGANRLSQALAASLFGASIDALRAKMIAHDDRELESTRYFVTR